MIFSAETEMLPELIKGWMWLNNGQSPRRNLVGTGVEGLFTLTAGQQPTAYSQSYNRMI